MAWQKLLDGPYPVEYDTGKLDYSGMCIKHVYATAEGALVVDMHEEQLSTSPDFGIMTDDGKVRRLGDHEAAKYMADYILAGAANE